MKYSNTKKGYINVQRGQMACGNYIVRDGGTSTLVGRERVRSFSLSSGKRLRRYLRNSVAEYRSFITLTYPDGYGSDCHSVKRDLDAFFKRLVRVPRGSGRDFSACWFLEFTAVGRAHIHLYCTDYVPKLWLSQVWYDIVGSNNPNHLKVGTNVKSLTRKRSVVVRYAVKYASKASQKLVPLEINWVGRFWGVRGLKTTVSATTTFQEGLLHQVEGAYCMRDIDCQRRKLIRCGKIERHVLDLDHFGVVLYLWPIDDDSIRLLLLPYVLALGQAQYD